jgi:hypothetical protein
MNIEGRGLDYSRLYFVSFASGAKCWNRALSRLAREVSQSYPSAHFLKIDKKQVGEFAEGLGVDFWEFTERYPKGYGLWMWKPIVAQLALSRVPEGDFLFFLDAGSSINPSMNARPRLLQYLDVLDKTNFLFFELALQERIWTKKSVIRHFDLRIEHQYSGQRVGGIFGLKASEDSRNLLRSWVQAATLDSGYLLLDPDSNDLEDSDFMAHRQDQSLLSVLTKSLGIQALPDETYFEDDWFEKGDEFPFWATRKCSGTPICAGLGEFQRFIFSVERRISTFRHQQTITNHLFLRKSP